MKNSFTERTAIVLVLSIFLLSLTGVSASDFTIDTTSDYDSGTMVDTATETNLFNIDGDELRINTTSDAWERWKNEGQVSGVVIGDLSGTEYRRAIKLNYTGEFILWGFAVYVISITGSPNDIYVALLEPDGANCRPNGVSGVITETPKVAYGDITTGAYNYFNFTNPVIINQTSCNWLALLTDGANPTNAYYLIYDNSADQGFRESLQSAMTTSNTGGSTWGTPTSSSGIKTKVLTVNYTTTGTWESDTIAMTSGYRLTNTTITLNSRNAQYEYRAPNNSSYYTNDTLPSWGVSPGAGQTVHPDIIDMGSVWNNHRYWLCHTPYPNGNDDDEFPQIVASNNTTTFVIPTGLTNPIWTIDQGAIDAGENAGDCDFAYDGTYLRAYWVYKNLTYDRFYMLSKRSTDGINWVPSGNDLGNAIEILNITVFPGVESPEVLYEDGIFHLWHIGTDSAGANANDTYIYYRSSSDGENFTSATNITSGFPVMTDTEFNVWHLDIDKVGDEYWGLFPMVHNRTAHNGETKSARAGLYWGWSSDRENWTIQDWYPIIHQGEHGDWDEREIYRSTFIMDGETMRIWYSGANDPGAWFVSYTEATIQDHRITQIDWLIDSTVIATYSTDIRIGENIDITTPDSGNFEDVNADFTIKLTFSSSGNSSMIVDMLYGNYEESSDYHEANNPITIYGIGADFSYLGYANVLTFKSRIQPQRDFTTTWYYGDGTISNEDEEHLYEDSLLPKRYEVRLQVCDGHSCVNETKMITVIGWSGILLWSSVTFISMFLIILSAVRSHKKKPKYEHWWYGA